MQKRTKILLVTGTALSLFGFVMLLAVRERVANSPSWISDAWWQAGVLLTLYRAAFFVGPALIVASFVLWLKTRRRAA